MLRKLSVVGICTMCGRGTVEQLVLMGGLTGGWMCVQIRTLPYKFAEVRQT